MIGMMKEFPKPPPGRTGWPWTPEAPDASSCRMVGESHRGGHWPRISVVTPSYNQGEFIEETIRSVLLQGYPELEYIVMDGGSTDNSVEIIRKYEPWLTHWETKPDKGQADAINKGFEHATGDLLAFLNSDDWYSQKAFRNVGTAYNTYNHYPHVLISGCVHNIREGEIQGIFTPKSMGRMDQWINFETYLHQCGCFWTRELWNQCGPFPTQMHYMFDHYFFASVRIFSRTVFVPLTDTLAFFRLHSSSKTVSQSENFLEEWKTAARRLRRAMPVLKRIQVNCQELQGLSYASAGVSLAQGSRRKGLRSLLSYLWKRPLAVFHRPVWGAMRRLLGKCSEANRGIFGDALCGRRSEE